MNSVSVSRYFRLEGNLAELTQRLPAPVVRVTETTALPSPLRRARSVRIDLADGTSWKGRIVPTAERASTMRRLLDLAGPVFAGPEHVLGEASLSRWIEGEALSDSTLLSFAELEECGKHLGELHRTPIRDLGLSTRSEDLDLGVRQDLEDLCRAERIDHTLVERALAVAQDRPENPEIGIIHHDFCGENLVRTPQGSIVCIDNAAISVGALDLDLARTWYRWELPRSQFLCFLRGYARLRSPRRFLTHAGFWCALVLGRAASIRLRFQTGEVARPLERLSALLERFEKGRRGTALLCSAQGPPKR